MAVLKRSILYCFALLFLGCSDWDFVRTEFTEVVTVGAIEVGSNVAFLLGDIEGLRNAGITETGFVLSSSVSDETQLRLDQPGILSVASQNQDTIKQERAFAARIAGLQASTSYAFRAYAKVVGEDQVVYGTIARFKTTDLNIFIKSIKRSSEDCKTVAAIEVVLDGFAQGGGTEVGVVWSEDLFLGAAVDLKGNTLAESLPGAASGSFIFNLPVECNNSYTLTAFASPPSTNAIFSELRSFSMIEGGHWIARSNFPGATRDLSVEFSIDNNFYMGGGKKPFQNFQESASLLDLWSYSAIDNRWSEIGQLANGISSPAAASANGLGYFGSGQWTSEKCLDFLGGNCLQGSLDGGFKDCGLCHCVSSEFFEFDPISRMTSKIVFPDSISAIVTRHSATAISIANKIFFGLGNLTVSCGQVIRYVAGLDSRLEPIRLRLGNFSTFRDMWQFDPSSHEWTKMQAFPKSERVGAIGFTTDNKGYFGLGFYYRDEQETLQTGPLKDFYEFDPTMPITAQWTSLEPFPEEFQYAKSFALTDIGYVLTKRRSSLTTPVSLWKFDRKEGLRGTWTKIADDILPGITGLPSAAATIGTVALVYLAGPQQNFWLYIPELN